MYKEECRFFKTTPVIMPRLKVFHGNECMIYDRLADKNFFMMTINPDGSMREIIPIEDIKYNKRKVSIPIDKYNGEKLLKYNIKIKGLKLTVPTSFEEYLSIKGITL